MHFVKRNGPAGFARVYLHHLFVAALAIEETHQLPGLGRKVEHGINTRHEDPHRRSAIHNVLFEDKIGVEARTALRNHARRDLRQSYFERSSQIHGRISIRRIAFIPGRSEPGGPTTSTMPSKVPLVGSTIGLNSTTLALYSFPGKSGTVRANCRPIFSTPTNFSGTVNRIRNGPSAVTQNSRSPLTTCCPWRT